MSEFKKETLYQTYQGKYGRALPVWKLKLSHYVK